MPELSTPTLAIAAGVTWIAGSVYLLVGDSFRRRAHTHESEERRALGFFSLWWYALGVNLLLVGALYLAAAFGVVDFEIQFAYGHLQRILLALSLVGLMYYLLHVATGRGRLALVASFYTLFLVLLFYSLEASEPRSVYVGQWRTELEPTREAPVLLSLVSFAAIILPPVLGSLAYFRLFFKLDARRNRTQRYRILLVSLPLIVWWVMAVLAGQRDTFGNESFQLVNRLVGLLVALAILAAYRPPARISRWLASGS